MFEKFDNFEPLDFLEFSEELNKCINEFNSNNSSIKRVIYGRIYYAVFLYVREWLKENMEYKSTNKDHTKIIEFIQENGPFEFFMNEKIADDLSVLKKLRHQADYQLVMPEEGSRAYKRWVFESIEDALNIADYIINSFENLS